jgi:uncharacterized protein with FMN-binding domain
MSIMSMWRARPAVLAALVILAGCGASSRKAARPMPSTAPGSAPATTDTATTSTTPSGGVSKRTLGQVFSTQFGPTQVATVTHNGRLVDVVTIAMPTDRPRSLFISDQAGPLLRREALQAQSAKINVVSGATYTSEAYARSLQSALDRGAGATNAGR